MLSILIWGNCGISFTSETIFALLYFDMECTVDSYGN